MKLQIAIILMISKKKKSSAIKKTICQAMHNPRIT